MSTAVTDNLARDALLEKLSGLGRTMSTQTVFLHQAIAQTIGLNATDTKCVDLILQSRDGALTPGELSAMSGLTTGAITHILDRLEKRNFIERRRDTADRRKVFVRVRLESLASVIPRYEAIGRAYSALAEQYSDADLLLICDYLEKATATSRHELARLIADARAPGTKKRTDTPQYSHGKP